MWQQRGLITPASGKKSRERLFFETVTKILRTRSKKVLRPGTKSLLRDWEGPVALRIIIIEMSYERIALSDRARSILTAFEEFPLPKKIAFCTGGRPAFVGEMRGKSKSADEGRNSDKKNPGIENHSSSLVGKNFLTPSEVTKRYPANED